ncbi:hypothetical protein JCM11251_003701 [Rhodosporidiobolus azoricus]
MAVLPRKAVRALRYIFVVACVLAFCWSRTCTPSSLSPSSSSASSSRPSTRSRNVDFAWGSILHRFQNHPRPARRRSAFPWAKHGVATSGGGKRTKVLIVTSELAGLHKNGGIGTAFVELAQALAGEDDFEMSILVSHVEETFARKKREALQDELATKRISLRFVEQEQQPFWPQAWTPTASMRVWRYLRAHDGEFDVIHFPDNTGIGYFSTLAKYEGLALRESRIVMGLHGADVEWAAMLNKRYPVDKYAIELGVFEKRTAEMADAVVAPSEYMLEYARTRGWVLPPNSFVIPNVVQTPALSAETNAVEALIQPIDELVFFGRLEERKGTRLLISTLESLYTKNSSALSSIHTITFLGRDQPDIKTRTDVSVLLSQALLSIQEHAANATFSYQFLSTYDRDEALSYLQQPSRLALLPSLADNSPSTVLECIAHGIRFIASNVGGVPELVHPADQETVLFSPLVGTFGAKLTSTLERLEKAPWKAVRPGPATQTAANDWIAFHRWLADRPASSLPSLEEATQKAEEPFISICITHYERPHLVPQLLDSLLKQSYTNFEVILVDDGSSSPATIAALEHLEAKYFSASSNLTLSFYSPSSTSPSPSTTRPRWSLHRHHNSYLGEARNNAFSHTSSDSRYILFLDDDDVLKPHALATLVGVATRTGAAALSTWLDEFATDINPLDPLAEGEELPHRRTYWFLGQELTAGLLSNCYGSGNVFVTRQAFEKLGGFSTYREVGAEDWEFWTRLALANAEMEVEAGGMKQLVVPEELIFVRSDPGRWSMKFSMDPWDAHFHATAPILNDPRIQDLNLAQSIMLLKGIVTRDVPVPAFADSRDGFQLVQGWGGWQYSFEPIDRTTTGVWTPSLAQDRLGIIDHDSSSFVLDRNHPRKPFIDDSYQEGWISSDGTAFASARTFRSPKRMDVAVELTYRASHTCGDGTDLALVSVAGPLEQPKVLVKWNTLDDTFGEYNGDVSLRAGSVLHLISDPLESDECDRVEVRLKVTPISMDNKSWSMLAKKAAMEAEEVRKESLKAPPNVTTRWSLVETKGPPEDQVFNVALIFDRNRYPHAKSVIRSVQHFLTSDRHLVFHLITPRELHTQLHEFFAGKNMTLRTYDHSLCTFFARKVLPFSDPDIHVSAHCKMFLPEIITIAERVLYLDTDVTVVSDLSRCYGRPLKNPSALISMGVDMGDACQNNPDACWPIGMHWRVPSGLGLECGNVPSRTDPKRPPTSCADEGELETLQVNGGVALLEISRMKETNFIERYVQSIVHHYRLMGGKKATWGEQDFINSYFRLYPNDLELLPCGCNYQWFGTRREVKCGEQEVSIAHHWSHGIARRTADPYNILFHHFASNTSDPLPPVPSLTPSLSGAPNSSTIAIENSLNCLRQNHECSTPYSGTEYGQSVLILSRVLGQTFAADLVDSIEAQTYPKIISVIAAREDVDVPEPSFEQERVELPADPEEEYAALCEQCGEFAATNESCSTAPASEALRKQYWDCVCALEDKNAPVMSELEAVAGASNEGWVLYLDDTHAFVSAESLSLLMAEVDDPNELVMFRSNTTSKAQDWSFRRKILPRSPLDGVGFLFHSDNLDITEWSSSTRCGKWKTLNRLMSRLKLKWLDLVPTMEHPLQRHLPATPAEDFQLSVVVLETQGKISWAPLLLELFELPELTPLLKEFVVASVDTEEGAYGPGVRIVNPTAGSGLAELANSVEGEHILLLSDSLSLDKAAVTAFITFHLDSPFRLIGLFTETDQTGDFSVPLPITEEDFDIFSEPDALVGIPTWTHLLPRALLTSRSNLEELTSVLATPASSSSPSATAPWSEVLHPICHPILLSAISTRASSGLPPLRVLPPPKSVVDRVYDCRVRNYPDIAYGKTAGDWAVPVAPSVEEEDEEEDVFDFDEDGDEALKEKDAPPPPEYDEADFPLPPSLDECVAAVAKLLGEGAETWLVKGDEIGVAGPLGVKVGVDKAVAVDEGRWQEARRMEKCYRI